MGFLLSQTKIKRSVDWGYLQTMCHNYGIKSVIDSICCVIFIYAYTNSLHPNHKYFFNEFCEQSAGCLAVYILK